MDVRQEYYNLQDEWYDKLLKAYTYGVWLLFAVEFIVWVIMIAVGANVDHSNLEQFLLYAFLPSAVNITTIYIMRAVFNRTEKRLVKQFLLTASLCIICFVVATVHCYYLSIYIVFVVPQLLSVIFDNKRFTFDTTITAILLTVLSIVLAPLFDQTWTKTQRISSGFIAICIFMASYIMCILYIHYGKKKNDIIIESACAQDILKETINTDQLTGLWNHEEFYRLLQETLDRVSKDGGECSLGVMDIDFFKHVNDTYGHQNGNTVLIKVADLLKETVGDIGYVSRYGGEEFSIIFPDKSKEELYVVMESVRTQFENTSFDFADGEYFTISGGVASVNNGSIPPKEFFDMADKALYVAKELGRNKIITA